MLKTAPALLAACAAMVFAAPAAADSIAYVKDGDVWLSSPDGARHQQVTRTGDIHYVSRADDGTMAVLVGGEKLRKLSPTGDVLAEFATPISDGAPQPGPVSQFAGPFEPEISPDGRLIAFEWQNASYYNHSGCSGASVPPCHILSSRWGVGITHSDRFTAHDEFGLLTGWIGPHWMSNDRLLRSGASVSPNEDAVINTIGPGKADDDMKRWFWDDNGASGVEEVEISRDGRFAAGVAGFHSDKLRIYRVLHDPMTAPAQKLGPFEDNPQVVEPCVVGDSPNGKFENLSFAPDGRALAYSYADGIAVTDVPDIAGGCGPLPASNKLVIPGGRHPHWSPADILPAQAYEKRADCGCVKPPDVVPGDQPAAPLAISLGAAKLRAALTRGVTVTVQAPAAGRLSGVAKVGARKVASGRASVGAPGATTLRLKFAKAAARSLKRKRSARVAVTVTFTPAAGGSPQVQKAAVLLKR